VTAEAHELRLEECVRCGECVEVCAAGALEMVGQRMTVEEALAVVRRDVPFYETSGGGMTLSGGEPLAQYDFTKALLTAAREEGIQTALETSALSIWERMEALQPLVNLFLVDLKHTDDARHRELTGVSNALILENIRRMSAREFPLTLRIPWIPGMNAEPTFLEGLIEFAACLSPRPPVEFLPYHRLHVSKRAALGMEASMPEEIPAAMPEEIAPWVERLAAEGIAARVR
jgi:pyruvate formate lyase activating enzyme